MAVNLSAVFLGCKFALPHMLKQAFGAIVNVASTAGLNPLPNKAAYCANKAGVIGLTRQMALQYARQGVRVNAVCPGTTKTPFVRGVLTKTGDPAVAEAAISARLPIGRCAEPDELANLGSLSGGLFPLAEEERSWKFDWEKPLLEGTCDAVFKNSFKSIAEILKLCRDFGTQPVCELHDLAMINNLAYLKDRGDIDRGTLEKPLTIEFTMGMLGQAPATVDNLVFFLRTAWEMLGEFMFAACGFGRQTIAIQAAALAMGGDSRVGMEDSLFVGEEGQLATSNAEQVKEVVQIADALGREVATPDDARKLLGLKGLDKVGF